MAEIIFHPEAEAEYLSARAGYQARSPQAAGRFEAEMGRVLSGIGSHPEMYGEYDEEHQQAMLKKFPYTVIFQTLSDGEVHVVAVAHTSRRPGYWHGRDST